MQAALIALVVVTTAIIPLLLLVLGFIVRKYNEKKAVPCLRMHFAPSPCLREHFEPEPSRAFERRDIPHAFRRHLPHPALLINVRDSIQHIEWYVANLFGSLYCAYPPIPWKTPDQAVVRQVLEVDSRTVAGRLPLNELLLLSKDHPGTFIRHYIATELFDVVDAAGDPAQTILPLPIVQLFRDLPLETERECPIAKVELKTHLGLILSFLLSKGDKLEYSNPNLTRLHDRLLAAVRPFLPDALDGRDVEDSIAQLCAETLKFGLARLRLLETLDIDWTTKNHYNEAVLVFPSVFIAINDDRGREYHRLHTGKIDVPRADLGNKLLWVSTELE